jgi:hypothetical protein
MRNPTIRSDLSLALINPHDDALRNEKCLTHIGR